jgi:hypothetical protein
MVIGKEWLDELLPMHFQAREGARLISPHQPAVADDIGGHDRRQTALNTRCRIHGSLRKGFS